MNKREAEFKANANHDDGTVPWHNDPFGRPFKSNLDKPLRPIAAFGCDRETNGGPVCPSWCGQDKCGVVLGEPESASGVAPCGEALPLMRAAIRTTVSCGPDSLYEMRFKFASLEAMQEADAEWRAHVSGVEACEPLKTHCARCNNNNDRCPPDGVTESRPQTFSPRTFSQKTPPEDA